MSDRVYCVYCCRVSHRCRCGEPDSRLRRFLARQPESPDYAPRTMQTPCKRGVPPQIKRRERRTLRRHYTDWYTALVTRYGERCLNCGADSDLVIDHVVSVAKGGLSQFDNLQLLCATCNTLKGKLCIDCRPAL